MSGFVFGLLPQTLPPALAGLGKAELAEVGAATGTGSALGGSLTTGSGLATSFAPWPSLLLSESEAEESGRSSHASSSLLSYFEVLFWRPFCNELDSLSLLYVHLNQTIWPLFCHRKPPPKQYSSWILKKPCEDQSSSLDPIGFAFFKRVFSRISFTASWVRLWVFLVFNDLGFLGSHNLRWRSNNVSPYRSLILTPCAVKFSEGASRRGFKTKHMFWKASTCNESTQVLCDMQWLRVPRIEKIVI